MRSSILLAILCATSATSAMAQTPAAPKPARRIPVAVLDARGTFARLGQDVLTAAGLSTPVTTLPAKGFGLAGGAHIYPLRGRSVAFGVGGEAVLARRSNAVKDATTNKPTGPVFNRRLRGISGQASLNFGHTMGWSYLTVGLGPMSFESYKTLTSTTATSTTTSTSTPILDGLRPMTLNFGGGARWFNFDHLAFTVDVRFYRTRAALATPNTAVRGNKTVLVMSAGFAMK